MVVCLSGVLPDLNPEDKVIKLELAECLPSTYSELVRSDIPGSSGLRSSRPAALRPSPPSIIKLSHDGPPATKTTKRELLARVETLSRKSRSVKCKTMVPRAPSSQPHSVSAAKARDSSGRAAEPPLEVMLIPVWNPYAQSAAPPSSRAEKFWGKSPGADGDDNSLLSNA